MHAGMCSYSEMFLSFGASLGGWRGCFVIVDIFVIVVDQRDTLFLSVAPMNEKFDVIVDIFVIVVDQRDTLFLSVAPMNEKFDKNNENTH